MNAKKRFLDSAFRKDFEKLTATEAFRVACDYALLDYTEDLPRSTNVTESWDSHSRLVGARELLEKLKNLHIPVQERKAMRGPELDWNEPNPFPPPPSEPQPL